jgi:hypothetical protein
MAQVSKDLIDNILLLNAAVRRIDYPRNRGDSSNGALQAATRGSHWCTRFMALHPD